MANYYWMQQYDDEWWLMLSINLYATEAEVIEWMQTSDNEEIFGRTLTIEDTASFLRSYSVKSEFDFENLMSKKDEKGILDLDHIHRHCERHGLKYKIGGLPLCAARRKYREEVKMEEETQKEHAFELCKKGSDFLSGRNGEEKDINKGLSLLEDAIREGCNVAYGRLAHYYLSKLKRGEAIAVARAGAEAGDPLSMYVLSVLYSEGADFENLSNLTTGKPDMGKAVEWCLKAARGGWYRAMRDLNKYIHHGDLVPDAKLYLELLVIQAKCNSIAMRNRKAKQKDF